MHKHVVGLAYRLLSGGVRRESQGSLFRTFFHVALLYFSIDRPGLPEKGVYGFNLPNKFITVYTVIFLPMH